MSKTNTIFRLKIIIFTDMRNNSVLRRRVFVMTIIILQICSLIMIMMIMASAASAATLTIVGVSTSINEMLK